MISHVLSTPNIMRNIKEFGSYSKNPYLSEKQTRTATIYQPDDYTLSLIVALPAGALRVFTVMAARIDPETGRAKVTLKELRDVLGGLSNNISASKTQLLRAKLIAYANHNNEFYINPSAFKPVSITI
jgi:hypothetical protein